MEEVTDGLHMHQKLKNKDIQMQNTGVLWQEGDCNILNIGQSSNKSVFKRIRPERPSAQVCGNGRIS